MPRLRLPLWLTPAVTKTIHVSARWTRPMTLGVRAAIFDEADRVLLVRHSYVRGWHLPGGAVEPGETAADALEREVREETGVVIDGAPKLHGIFFNRGASKRDHVLVYEVRRFRQQGAPASLEIVERGFFAADHLPPETTGATSRRIGELLEGRALMSDW